MGYALVSNRVIGSRRQGVTADSVRSVRCLTNCSSTFGYKKRVVIRQEVVMGKKVKDLRHILQLSNVFYAQCKFYYFPISPNPHHHRVHNANGEWQFHLFGYGRLLLCGYMRLTHHHNKRRVISGNEYSSARQCGAYVVPIGLLMGDNWKVSEIGIENVVLPIVVS